MELDKIIKALECHANDCKCSQCPMSKRTKEGYSCWTELSQAALALIKELAEENEYLKQQNEIYEVLNKKLEDACESYAWTYGTAVSKELFLKREREDAVREMQEKIKEKSEYGTINISHWQLDQITEEMLEEKK